MTHNFSDDELNYLNPEDDDDGAEPGTEAAAFDPFADEDGDDTQNSADAEVEEVLMQVGAPDTAAATEAVAFDPFADDEDDSEESFTDPDNIAALIKDLGQLRDQREKRRNDGSALLDTSQRSRQQALDTFRELRLAARTNREVADGMVTLPFVVPTAPEDALIDPDKAVKEKKIPPPQLKPGDIVASQY